MSAHTPWIAYCRDSRYQEGPTWSRDAFLQWEIAGPDEPPGRGSFYEDEAKLIVRCVNAHDELVAALRCCLAAMTEDPESDVDAMLQYGQAVDAARAALAKVSS